MAKKTNESDEIKQLLAAEVGGKPKDWIRTAKKKNVDDQWERRFENKSLKQAFNTVEVAYKAYRIDGYAPAREPSAQAFEAVKIPFKHSLESCLDWVLEDKEIMLEMAVGCACTSHNDAILGARGELKQELALYAPTAFKNVKIDINELHPVREGGFTADNAAKKLEEWGFRVEGADVFYDHDLIRNPPAPENPAVPTFEDVFNNFLQLDFVCNVFEYGRDIEEFEGSFDEINSQNEYNITDKGYKHKDIKLKHIRDLSVSDVWEKSETKEGYGTVDDFKAKLEELGFIVEGDRLVGHESCKPARAKAPGLKK